ncbi:unnamed protein product [Pelagomonas calceolata]|uniref:MYND-type domain-containing protein n=1 Tax=Pelagomonas calceolata TaxID=35677 RepID=A0A8J2WGE3_9STRA|nr:unnamed protein product [Pelagomonas calceolata]
MILTNCAACAAPLAHDAPRCVRCWTRYCDSTCQHDHWRRGHKQMCKKIHRGGNAEQFNADKKYKEAVAVAVEACAEDTKGQTCYICTQALHWKTKEGLVRGCSCRGTAGFAHVSCLAEQAKILVAEADDELWGANVATSPLHDRKWTQYIGAARTLIKKHGDVRAIAQRQVDDRTAHFWGSYAPADWVAMNRVEWAELHHRLAGREVPVADQLERL